MANVFAFELGTSVKDTISGYTGKIVSRTEYLHGTPRYCVQAPLHDGEPVDPLWADEGQIVAVS